MLGSAVALIDSTVVNIALPAIDRDLDAGVAGLTWTVNGYTLTLAAFILVGGSLGDRLGRRRIFLVGVVVFGAASLLCTLAPGVGALVAARALQGVGGALLTPGSLAIIQATFRAEDRSRAIGAWSGLSGVAAAVGPFLGGFLLLVGSWRWIFLINLPVTVLVVAIAVRHVPESRDRSSSGPLDLPGALLVVAGLGALSYGLTAWADHALASPPVLSGLLSGLACLVGFVLRERVARAPMLPLGVFAGRVFSVTNLVTFLVYAGLGGVFFWLVVTLQVVAGFGPMAAGLSLLPVTVLMLLFSPLAGVVGERFGPRLPMSAGPLVAAAGVVALLHVGPAATYLVDVLAPVTLLGIGLTLTVTPLTTTALAAVPQDHAGLASGVNNAMARTGGLLVVAVLPVLSGLGGRGFHDPATLEPAFRTAMLVCAGLLAGGGVLSLILLPSRAHRPQAPAGSGAQRHCAVDATPLGATPLGATAPGGSPPEATAAGGTLPDATTEG